MSNPQAIENQTAQNTAKQKTSLNPENLQVMAKDRHRLSRLKKDLHKAQKQKLIDQKSTDSKATDPKATDQINTAEAKYQQLLQSSHEKVIERQNRLPEISLNQDLPVSQYADKLIDAIQKHQVIIVA